MVPITRTLRTSSRTSNARINWCAVMAIRISFPPKAHPLLSRLDELAEIITLYLKLD